MLTIVALLALKGISIVSMGVCLGVGFALSRKLINRVDGFLSSRRTEKILNNPAEVARMCENV